MDAKGVLPEYKFAILRFLNLGDKTGVNGHLQALY
jgi:hypothetical protein